MILTYKSVYDGINENITNVLDKYGIKYERETVFNDSLQMHETVLNIHYKNSRQKDGITYLINALNILAD